jgi:hypothetical protein
VGGPSLPPHLNLPQCSVTLKKPVFLNTITKKLTTHRAHTHPRFGTRHTTNEILSAEMIFSLSLALAGSTLLQCSVTLKPQCFLTLPQRNYTPRAHIHPRLRTRHITNKIISAAWWFFGVVVAGCTCLLTYIVVFPARQKIYF